MIKGALALALAVPVALQEETLGAVQSAVDDKILNLSNNKNPKQEEP